MAERRSPGRPLDRIVRETVVTCRSCIQALVMVSVVTLLAASLGGCAGGGRYDKGKYCAAVGVATSGAMDEHGARLNEFGPEDKRRSYEQVARLAPSGYRADWERIADSFGELPDLAASLKAAESQRRITPQVKEACGIELTVFWPRARCRYFATAS